MIMQIEWQIAALVTMLPKDSDNPVLAHLFHSKYW